MKIIITFISGVTILFFLMVIITKNKIGTFALFYSAYEHSIKKGKTCEEAYFIALSELKHHSPISEMSDLELRETAIAFSHFKDPVQISVLLKESLNKKDKRFLKEPFLGKLIKAGNEKGLCI